MKPFHIITRISGEQDTQAAIIRIDGDAVHSILDARNYARILDSRHNCTASVNLIGNYSITFLSDIPEGYIEGVPDITCLYDQEHGIILRDLDEPAFLAACESQGLLQPSELTGLRIYPQGIYITGFEKHCDTRLESHDTIHPLYDEMTA